MNSQSQAEVRTNQSYLLFKFLDELYGTPLSIVQEVVPYIEPRAVPNTKRNYLGIINLRGEIASVIDLRFWFSDEKVFTKRPSPHALVVVESPAGVMAISVDCVEGVCSLDSKDVESANGMSGPLSSLGMIGIGRFKQGLATLLDLRALCTSIDVASERKERLAS